MNCIDLKKSGVINFRASLKVFCLILFVFLVPSRQSVIAQDLSEREPTTSQLMQGKVYIYKLYPQDRIGKGYKLVYMVAVPLEIHWKFKTDFENDFLLSNKLITEQVIRARDSDGKPLAHPIPIASILNCLTLTNVVKNFITAIFSWKAMVSTPKSPRQHTLISLEQLSG